MDPPTNTGAARTAKGEVRIEEPTRAERLIARRAAESRATVPHVELTAIVDMSRAEAMRADIVDATDAPSGPSLTAIVVRACALALRAHPRANGAYRDGHFELYSRVNIGVAIMTDAAESARADSVGSSAGAERPAFAVPTVLDADTKSALEIDSELRALAASVHAGTITPPELAGATFTVFNLGMLGVSSFHPPVVPPQAAILAVGEVREVPVVRKRDIVVGREMNVTLACDHRILYGVQAAGFLTRIRALLEQPRELMSQ